MGSEDKNKEMDCCSTIETSETNCSPLDQINTNEAMTETDRCVHCGGKGRAVSRKTVLLMVKPHLLERAMLGSYNFNKTVNRLKRASGL